MLATYLDPGSIPGISTKTYNDMGMIGFDKMVRA